MAEHRAELIVAHLTDIGAFAAEARDAGKRVGRRAARDFHRRGHAAIERIGAFRIDQRHRPFFEPEIVEQSIFGLRQYIDDRVANAYYIQRPFGHR